MTNNRERLGFRDGEKGAHSSRTIMLAELATLLGAAPADAHRSRMRELVLDENLLGKRSAANRHNSFRHLSELYGLDAAMPAYRIFRRLWGEDAGGRPLLALLCAVARDPLLRASTDLVLDLAPGAGVDWRAFAATVDRPLAPTTLKSIGQNLASSWTQAGFLSGVMIKTRAQARATPGAATYALALGFMEGGRGGMLLSTAWTRLLDIPADGVLSLVQQASRRGWVEYRAAGDVIDLRVDAWFTDEERGWCDGR